MTFGTSQADHQRLSVKVVGEPRTPDEDAEAAAAQQRAEDAKAYADRAKAYADAAKADMAVIRKWVAKLRKPDGAGR